MTQNHATKNNENTTGAAQAKGERLNNAAEEARGAPREGVNRIVDLRDEAAERTRETLRAGLDMVSSQTREATDRISRNLGYSGAEAERFAQQSKQNLEAVIRCGTVLSQALQDASRAWLEIGQKQLQRNLDGMNRLARSGSVQEFTAIQIELIRNGMETMVRDSRTVAETSLRAVDDASKAFEGAALEAPNQGKHAAA